MSAGPTDRTSHETPCSPPVVSGKVMRGILARLHGAAPSRVTSTRGRVDHDQHGAPLAVGGLLGTGILLHALPGPVDRVRAEEGERHPGLVLVLLHRWWAHAPDLCRLSPGSSLHPRPGGGALRLLPQSLPDPAQGAAAGRSPHLTNQGRSVRPGAEFPDRRARRRPDGESAGPTGG